MNQSRKLSVNVYTTNFYSRMLWKVNHFEAEMAENTLVLPLPKYQYWLDALAHGNDREVCRILDNCKAEEKNHLLNGYFLMTSECTLGEGHQVDAESVYKNLRPLFVALGKNIKKLCH